MTTIAWDGRILAADRRLLDESMPLLCHKIFRAGRFYYGQCGSSGDCELVTEWLRGGAKPARRPSLDGDDHGIAIDTSCMQAYFIEGKSPTLVKVEEQRCAAGSGRFAALVAMELGKTATEAVELAARFDTNTGGGVDHVVIVPRRKRS